MKQSIIISISLILALSSCKKDDKKSALSTSDLTTGTWRLTAQITKFTEDGQTTTQDDMTSISTCEKDDIYQFGTDNKITKDQGPTKCYQGQPQTEQKETWELANGKLSFKSMQPNGYVNTYDVIELNSSTLHLREYDQDGDLYIVRDYTYSH